MSGKASLLVVAGFSMLFLIISQNFGSVSNRAVDNLVDYHTETIAHNIAVSGANLVANKVYFDNTWDEGYSDIPFQGGMLDVTMEVIDPYQDLSEITSTGTYNGYTSTVKVKMAPSRFSKFAYFSIYEGGNIWWTGSDTVWGPFHTQDYIRCYRHPVFYGKTTTKRRLRYYTSKRRDKPRLYGGFERGVNLPLPEDGLNKAKLAAQDDGLYFNGADTVYITMDRDSIRYRYSYNSPDTALHLSSVAPNGVIFANNSVVRLKGVVSGQYSIACSGSGSNGRIYLDDDIVFDKDPRIHPTSIDLLGIISENEVLITDNTPNHSDINIHAAIYAGKGGFGSENYSSRPVSGNINLLGGITQHTRRAVGTFNWSGAVSGFSKRYKYDERLMLASPPYFPGTGNYEIVSWYE